MRRDLWISPLFTGWPFGVHVIANHPGSSQEKQQKNVATGKKNHPGLLQIMKCWVNVTSVSVCVSKCFFFSTSGFWASELDPPLWFSPWVDYGGDSPGGAATPPLHLSHHRQQRQLSWRLRKGLPDPLSSFMFLVVKPVPPFTTFWGFLT